MKKTLSLLLSLIFVFVCSACGNKTASQKGENIVKSQDGERNYEVHIDERNEETHYEYGKDDLSLVDTNSGKKITLGMKTSEIEAITGKPKTIENDYKVYDGISIKYTDDTVVSLIVSISQFDNGEETRYKTSRGVGIGTNFEDFKKTYGDSYVDGKEIILDSGEQSKTSSTAIRYFKKSGLKLEFTGTEYPTQISDEELKNYYIQDFMFSSSSQTVTTIRISLLSAVSGGI